MKKTAAMIITVFIMLMMAYSVNATTIAYIDYQKVFTNYEKTKKVQDDLKKKELLIQEEITKKQKLYEKEKENKMSDGDLRKLAEKFQKEIEIKRNDLMESSKKMTNDIQNDIVKATEVVVKNIGVEIVLDKQIIITGGTDISDKVLEQLNKK
ncbi:MAG: OmpH family outer membrane protein [Syntrophaceae bacterium]|nr:OmpH family outer membrane protein [Syntrophaceae bacterium]